MLTTSFEDPFSYTGTVAFFDCSVLRQAFIFAHQVKIPHFRTQGSPILGERVSTSDLVLRVVRVGSLERKDDIPSVGKKAGSRKWKTCGVLLLDNQLILLVSCRIFSILYDPKSADLKVLAGRKARSGFASKHCRCNWGGAAAVCRAICKN